jgi:hypothetical protein
MVIINFTFPPSEYLIPSDLKRSTIRRRNPRREEQIERIGTLQLYWHHRTPICKLLGERELRTIRIIDEPILEFVHTAPPEVIYCEGFGHDRHAMELFFLDLYNEKIIGREGEFYIAEWHPLRKNGVLR